MHQSSWSFGFDSQTRGTRENRAPPCVKVLTGVTTGPTPDAHSFVLGPAVINNSKHGVTSNGRAVHSTDTIPLPPREQLYNRYCSNKHTPVSGKILAAKSGRSWIGYGNQRVPSHRIQTDARCERQLRGAGYSVAQDQYRSSLLQAVGQIKGWTVQQMVFFFFVGGTCGSIHVESFNKNMKALGVLESKWE